MEREMKCKENLLFTFCMEENSKNIFELAFNIINMQTLYCTTYICADTMCVTTSKCVCIYTIESVFNSMSIVERL